MLHPNGSICNPSGKILIQDTAHAWQIRALGGLCQERFKLSWVFFGGREGKRLHVKECACQQRALTAYSQD